MRHLFLVFFTLAVVLALPSGHLQAASDAKPLSVTFTYGHNGILRADNRFLPGEILSTTVILRDYPIPASGICQFSMRYSLVDKEGKTIFTHANDNIIEQMEVGTTLVKLMLRCELTTLLKAGDYDFVMQLRDKKTRELYKSSQPVSILPPDEFTITEFLFSADPYAKIPLGTTFETCQLVYINWNTFNLQTKEGRHYLEINFRVLDANHQPVDPPRDPEQRDLPTVAPKAIHCFINLQKEIPGDYFVEVTLKDLVSGKTETRSIPFRVVPSLSDILPAPAQ